MAILTANAAIDMTDWNFDNITGGTITRHTPLQYFLTGVDGITHYQFTGAGLTYDGSNNLTGGLVTGYKVLDDDGNVLFNVSGFSVGATVVGAAIASGDASGTFEAAVFGDGDNEINGSAFDDVLTDSAGNDTIKAGDGDDLIMRTHASFKTIEGGAGDDTLYDSAESYGMAFDGGDGNDTVILDHSNNFIVQSGGGLGYTNVESLILTGNAGRNAILLADDTAVAAGTTMHIDASALGATSRFILQADAETDGKLDIIGGAGNDSIIAGGEGDSIHLERGGSDHVQGGDSGDTFFMGAALDAKDRLDGGADDLDTVILDGNYAAGLTLGARTFTDIEQLFVQAGHNYKIIEDDHNVAAGKSLTVAALYLSGANKVYFDGSAETDGTFGFADGAGNDTFIGGALGDSFTSLAGGHNVLLGGGGADEFDYINGAFNAAEVVDGGADDDLLSIAGDYSAGLTFLASTMANVETLTLGSFYNYDIVLNDAGVAAGQLFNVDATQLLADDSAKIDGSAETNGRFFMKGGAGDDTLIGGARFDALKGGLGADLLVGGLGKDKYLYGAAAESTGRTFDTIDGFNPQGEKVDVVNAVTGIDADVNGGRLSDGTFDTDLALHVDAPQLLAGHALIYRPGSGDHAGETFLVVDQNGVAGYDAGVDLVIRLLNPTHLNHLDIGDFT